MEETSLMGSRTLFSILLPCPPHMKSRDKSPHSISRSYEIGEHDAPNGVLNCKECSSLLFIR